EVDATATPPTITLEQQVSGHEHTTPERSRPGPSSAGRPVTNAAPFAVNDVLIHRRARPTGGWRAALYTATGGRCNPGLSLAQAEHRLLLDRVRTPLRGAHQIVVTSLKGGIGKTTITAGLGLTLAEHRGDRIIALDANPDAGTLADRLTGHVGVTIRDLLDNLDTITSWTDIAHYTSIAGRLQVLASDQDPALSEAFNRDQYTAVTDLLRRYFSVLITDSGTGLVHSAMAGALQAADTLVIAAAPTLDGASRAAKTLDWLVAHDHAHLVEHAVVALSHDRSSRWVDPRPIREHFTRRCHAVIDIPQDPHRPAPRSQTTHRSVRSRNDANHNDADTPTDRKVRKKRGHHRLRHRPGALRHGWRTRQHPHPGHRRRPNAGRGEPGGEDPRLAGRARLRRPCRARGGRAVVRAGQPRCRSEPDRGL